MPSFILIIIICLFIYEHKYYSSCKFYQLKERLSEYVCDCNDLNKHIINLSQTYKHIHKNNYGKYDVTHNNKLNYKMPELNGIKSSMYIYDCSSTVCNNARNKPFDYLCKYFNIEKTEKTLEEFEDVLNKFSALEDGKFVLRNKLKEIEHSIENELPFLIKIRIKTFMRRVGFQEVNFAEIYFPTYVFRYVSPGGNKSMSCNISLNIENLNDFITYLSESIKFKQSVAGQRALMTTKLRDMIKERDNYTCQMCGLSTDDEKNLLLEIDHIIPISKGGLSTEDNLQVLCWKCNRSKGAKILIE